MHPFFRWLLIGLGVAAIVLGVRHVMRDDLYDKAQRALARSQGAPPVSASRRSTRPASAGTATPAGGPAAAQTDILEHRLRSTRRVKELQRLLQQAGFDPGPLDGALGPRTQRALMAFQRAQGLQPNGIAGEETWRALSRRASAGR